MVCPGKLDSSNNRKKKKEAAFQKWGAKEKEGVREST
jgi:hypothetical protein